MKCIHCGAEIPTNSHFCEYCGSALSFEEIKEQEMVNRAQCPKCGSTNISYSREKKGTVQRKKQTSIVMATMGVCQDCGSTWEVAEQAAPRRKTWLWVFGWILIFPLPLMLILLKNKKMNKVLKIAIIAVAWAVYALIVIAGMLP